MKVVTVLGTRPEIIKLSPVIPLLDKRVEHKVIHTGQHYNYEMDRIFFEELRLRDPDYTLNVGSGTHATQTAKMMVGIEKILMECKPDLVNVFADPNTPLAGALAAVKLGIPVCHMEAGCRSFNRRMPEEINRVLVDHCSDLLLASDNTAVKNLVSEGIPKEKIHMVGSTVVDACTRNSVLAEKSRIIEKLSLSAGEYVVTTLHRAENTDNRDVLGGVIEAINTLSRETKLVFPIHPRTESTIEKNKIKIDDSVIRINPLGYMDFLKLFGNAKFIITDSGGIQEEADVLNVPCIIARNETEWTELVEAGKNTLATAKKENILRYSRELLYDKTKLNKIKSIGQIRKPGASEKTVNAICDYLGKGGI